MRIATIQLRRQARPLLAFTMVEIMTAVAVTTLIVFALIAMFNQVQKALQGSLDQSDVWEAARSSFGVVAKELQEATLVRPQEPAGVLQTTNIVSLYAANPLIYPEPASQITMGTNTVVRNRFQIIYTVNEESSGWQFSVFFIHPADSAVGSLYMGQGQAQFFDPANAGTPSIVTQPLLPGSSHPVSQVIEDLPNDQLDPTQYHKLTDGVVSFNLQVFDESGIELAPTGGSSTNYVKNDASFNLVGSFFDSRRMPGYVELDMSVINPSSVDELRAVSVGGPVSVQRYLDTHQGDIMRFKQRIRVPVNTEAVVIQ